MIEGTLKRIDPKPEKHPQMKAVCFKADETDEDDWFTTFMDMSDYSEGDRVAIDVNIKEKNGSTYKNITGIKSIGETEEKEQTNHSSKEMLEKVNSEAVERSFRIEKQTALKAAVEFSHNKTLQNLGWEYVVGLADHFLSWLVNVERDEYVSESTENGKSKGSGTAVDRALRKHKEEVRERYETSG